MSAYIEKTLNTNTTSLPGYDTTKDTLPCCADFAVYPIGTTVPFSDLIDVIEQVLKKCNIEYSIHEQGTVMHGEMTALMHAIKTCHQALLAMGCPHVISNIRVDTKRGQR
ncbi:hypothetical protein BGZ93_006474 [Podila epicladia]|nr:hypothetical protein BGZ92_001018 [Podila epicladia]KAG0099666.1 hypothetical protein BGZ93_006474 [Podila epicladia]